MRGVADVRRLEHSFEDMAKAMGSGPKAEAAAITAWCAMVGAITLSRVFRGADRSDQILQLARRFILAMDAPERGTKGFAAPNDRSIQEG